MENFYEVVAASLIMMHEQEKSAEEISSAIAGVMLLLQARFIHKSIANELLMNRIDELSFESCFGDGTMLPSAEAVESIKAAIRAA